MREGKAEGGTKERREKKRREESFVLHLLLKTDLTKDSRLHNASPSMRYPGSIQEVSRGYSGNTGGSKNFHPA